MPSREQAAGKVIRVNDGNDSSIDRQLVEKSTAIYPMRFYNTSRPNNLESYPAPVVFTVNPGTMTDYGYYRLAYTPPNLMFVRVRVNTWNLGNVHGAVQWYSGKNVPVVLTFMAYHSKEENDLSPDSIPPAHLQNYFYRKRTLNSYWAIQYSSWRAIMARWYKDPLVYSCGQETLTSLCKHCGNCLREYFATMERISGKKRTPA